MKKMKRWKSLKIEDGTKVAISRDCDVVKVYRVVGCGCKNMGTER